MSTEKYYELIDQVCERLAIADSKSMYDACNLQIGDIAFTLAQGGEQDEEGLYIYCDFGDLPYELMGSVLPRLMEANLYFYGDNAPRFGFNSATGHILLVNRLPIARTTSEWLMQLLSSLADVVPAWRSAALTDQPFGQMPVPPLSQQPAA